MMEPEKMQSSWKHILDSLRDTKEAVVESYRWGKYTSRQEQQAEYDRMAHAVKAYDDALTACIAGQDPIIWKLSYSG